MLIAMGLLVVFVSNFESFLNVVLWTLDCREWGTLCPLVLKNGPPYFELLAVTMFLVTVAVATIRRISVTPISNYWAVFLSILYYIDHRYLTGISALWNSGGNSGMIHIVIPWFLVAAVSLTMLLSFATHRSTYFMQGYWNADPPLGYCLSISSFWMLLLATPRAMRIVAESTGSFQLGLTTAKLQAWLAYNLPTEILSPAIPAAVFSASALLLIVLGRFKAGKRPETRQSAPHRMQSAIQTTRAAQSLNGLKM